MMETEQRSGEAPKGPPPDSGVRYEVQVNGRENIYYRGLKYRPVGGNSERGQLYWRCSKSGCKGRLHTSLGYDQPKMVSSHSCPYGMRQGDWDGLPASPARRSSNATNAAPNAPANAPTKLPKNFNALVLRRNAEMLEALRNLPSFHHQAHLPPTTLSHNIASLLTGILSISIHNCKGSA